MNNQPKDVALLRAYKARAIEITEQINQLKEELKDEYAAMQASGFSVPAVKRLVKRHFETNEQRAKREAVEEITDIYAAKLGILGGIPLGEAARDRLNKLHQSKPDDDAPEADEADDFGAVDAEDVSAAKQRGREDAAAGTSITANPYLAGDPRRAAWDEGWCEETGSDGMDLPDELKPKPKKPKGEGGEGNGGGDE